MTPKMYFQKYFFYHHLYRVFTYTVQEKVQQDSWIPEEVQHYTNSARRSWHADPTLSLSATSCNEGGAGVTTIFG